MKNKKLARLLCSSLALVAVLSLLLSGCKDSRAPTDSLNSTADSTPNYENLAKSFVGAWKGKTTMPAAGGFDFEINFDMTFNADGTVAFAVDKDKFKEAYLDFLTQTTKNKIKGTGLSFSAALKQMGYSSIYDAAEKVSKNQGYKSFDDLIDSGAEKVAGDRDGSKWKIISEAEIKFISSGQMEETDIFVLDGSNLTLKIPETGTLLRLTRA